MNVKVTFDQSTFGRNARRLMALTGKSLEKILIEQAGLFSMDAQKLTPPFGDAPIEEGIDAQLKLGRKAVMRDIEKAFPAVDELRIYNSDSRFRKYMNKAFRSGQMDKAAGRLRVLKLLFGGATQEPNGVLHREMRDRYGRVRAKNRAWYVLSASSREAYLNAVLQLVGNAKSGWNAALRKLGRKVNRTLGKLPGNGSGYCLIGSSETKPFVEVANSVPYAQKMRGHIELRALDNRMRNVQKQVQIQERKIKKALKEAGLQ